MKYDWSQGNSLQNSVSVSPSEFLMAELVTCRQCYASLAYAATAGDQMLTSLQPLRFLQTRYGFMWWDGLLDSPVVGDIAHQESQQNTATVWKVANCREGVEGLAQVNRLLLSRISPRGGIIIAKQKGIKPTHPSYVQQSELNNLRSISAGWVAVCWCFSLKFD